jgi:hypothetical protein
LTSVGSQDIFIAKLTQPVTPSINITTPSSAVISGQTAVVSSTSQNGGSNPTYQWLDSTSSHGWQNIAGATASVLNYVPVQTGDRVRCLLTSNASCTNNITGLSNIIIFTVNPVTAINPVPGNTYGIKQFPNPTSSIFYIDSLKLSDKWEMLELINMSGERLFSSSIANKIRISLNVKDLPAGQYVVVLRRKNGSAYLKFIKQ